MENTDIRWKQRFQNFERSLQYLEQALQITHPDIIQKAGLIQFFEMSFELAWNVDIAISKNKVPVRLTQERCVIFHQVILKFWITIIKYRKQ